MNLTLKKKKVVVYSFFSKGDYMDDFKIFIGNVYIQSKFQFFIKKNQF